jgi:hypothetical protein
VSDLERGYASVENEEYRKGYRDGWRDAMNELATKPVWPTPPTMPSVDGVDWDPACKVCGLKGVMGYVCPRSDCPTRITC